MRTAVRHALAVSSLIAAAAITACSGDKEPTVPEPTTRSVVVTFSGTGGGTVASTTPTGVSCTATCTSTISTSANGVTMTATPNATSTFVSWSGDCTGTLPTCVISRSGSTTLNATVQFNLVTYTLTTALAGAGTGTITSAPAGINCGTDCTEAYTTGTAVTLTAAPSATSTFTGWSGGGCTGTATTCVVTMSQAATVTATFALQTRTLTVTPAGTGTGTVTSAPAGIACGTTCSGTFNVGTAVTLTAAPAANSTFAGWSGACTGTGACVVTLNAASTVTATFTLNTFTLTVVKAGTGGGTVASTPAGVTCGSDCTEPYNAGTAVTLTAAADATSVFAGWAGACTGTAACVVTMNAAATVTATFNVFQARWPDSPTRVCTNLSNIVACPGGVAGQDGMYTINVPTYETSTNRVRDDMTGLVWQRIHPTTNFTHAAATTYCADLVLDGLDDWRLPSLLEMASITDFGALLPPLPSVFSGVPQNSNFWTSTDRAGQSTQAIGVNTNYPVARGDEKTKSENQLARCVRGAALGGTLTASAGSVTDSRTGLVWQSGVSPTSLNWANAISYCENLVLDGNSDWRLPNGKELLSIVDVSRVPTFSAVFSSQLVSTYWSSSIMPNQASQAYAIDFLSGLSSDIGTPINNTMAVRCVR